MTYQEIRYGYAILGNDHIVTIDSFQRYFESLVKEFACDRTAEFVKVEFDQRYSQFHLHYTVEATNCGECEDSGVTEGVCSGHAGYPHQVSIDYTRVDLYL